MAGNAPAAGGNGANGNGASGSGNGGLLRITADGSAETHWEFDESVHALVVSDGEVLVGTGENGRVYQVEGAGMRLLADLPSGQIGAIVTTASGPMAMGSNPAGVYRFTRGGRTSASYTSVVRDAGSVARWGRLQFSAVDTGGAHTGEGVAVYVRSGNTLEPGSSWSDWDGPYSGNVDGVEVPPARYAQVRVDLAVASETPHLRRG